MRIVSLNTWGGAMFDQLAPWLETVDADVLCLQEVTRTPTKARAIQYATGMEADRDRGDYLDPNAGKVRLDEIWPRWIGSRTVDPASEIQYESKWRLHLQPMFGRRMVKSILPSEIAVWLTDLISAYGPSTAQSAFLVLNGCLELAVADELIKRNPGQSRIVKKPARRSSKVVAWSDETVDSIIEAHPRSSGSFRSSDRQQAYVRERCSDSRTTISISISKNASSGFGVR